MARKEELITVIVPCYNVEKYVRRCLDSLVAQTYKNLKIIMVEDCSTDNTKKIVKEYEKKHKNFKAIYNKRNGGLGHARNVGIKATTSKYIGFLDSDDWLPENFYEVMYDTLITKKAEVSVCDIYKKYDEEEQNMRIIAYSDQPDSFGIINTGMAACSCNKLFKREMFNYLRYPEDIVNEDVPVVLAILYQKKVSYTNKTFFNYYQRKDSLQNQSITDKRFDAFESVKLLRKNLNDEIDKKTWQIILWHQILAILFFVLPKRKNIFTRRVLIKKFYLLIKKYQINIINNVGLINFVKKGKANKFYVKNLSLFFDKKLFLACSLWMGLYSFYVNSKMRFTK